MPCSGCCRCCSSIFDSPTRLGPLCRIDHITPPRSAPKLYESHHAASGQNGIASSRPIPVTSLNQNQSTAQERVSTGPEFFHPSLLSLSSYRRRCRRTV